ncbi:Bardet-Biedl syndrome 5 protein [Clydaea vesicula]|uniref:BBSome complex member BBS5 n=1 Tax=Clydaea vesicula TaxID=447962 RepID=A0AAD5XTD2_9FUNG|nr:Bardet-Biedl syndrome 5 protein [Clydaea vesicula]
MGECIISTKKNLNFENSQQKVKKIVLILTNLRILIKSEKIEQEEQHENIVNENNDENSDVSIGLTNILNINLNMQYLSLNCKFDKRNYFFKIYFVDLKFFNEFSALIETYRKTKVYRELLIRKSDLFFNTELVILKKEKIHETVDGVCNLAVDQGNLGTLSITNLRVAWNSTQEQNFNVSIPYLQIEDVKLQKSKYGMALCIKTSSQTVKSMRIGFQIYPEEKLKKLAKLIKACWKSFFKLPYFGIDLADIEKKLNDNQKNAVSSKNEIFEINKSDEIFFNFHWSEGLIEVDKNLGLAVDRDTIKHDTEIIWRLGI